MSVTVKNAPYSVPALPLVDEKSKSRSASGLVSLIPTRVFVVSSERSGVAVSEVANEKALTAVGIVLVEL